MNACGLHIGAFTCQDHLKRRAQKHQGEIAGARLGYLDCGLILWHLFHAVACRCCECVTLLGYTCRGFTKDGHYTCQWKCLSACGRVCGVCVCVSQPQTIKPPVCLNPAPFLLTPSTHAHTQTRTYTT